jgi:hypothetical protein
VKVLERSQNFYHANLNVIIFVAAYRIQFLELVFLVAGWEKNRQIAVSGRIGNQ